MLAAFQLQHEVLEARKWLGAEHAETLSAKENLALTLKQAGRVGAAEILEREVVSSREKLLGADHSDTLRARGNLAVTLWEMGDREPAELVEQEILACRMRQPQCPASVPYGTGGMAAKLRWTSPTTSHDSRSYGEHYDNTDADDTETTDMCEGSLDLLVAKARAEKFPKLLGPELSTLWDKAIGPEMGGADDTSLLARVGDLAVAARVQGEVLLLRERLLGPDHSETQRARKNLAETLREAYKLATASKLEREVYERFEEELSSAKSPSPLGSDQLELGAPVGPGQIPSNQISHSSQKDRLPSFGWDEASSESKSTHEANDEEVDHKTGRRVVDLREEPQHRHALANLEKQNGPFHPDTLRMKLQLAAALRQSGSAREEEAKRLEAEVEKARRMDVGASEPRCKCVVQ